MKDQAEALRKKLREQESSKMPKTFAVVSGKGGVGKSNFSLNFAISLSKKGHKVLLFDMDVGMGNIDILLGNSAKMTIADFFEGTKSLQEIVMEGPDQLHYIAGGTGLNRLFKMSNELHQRFLEELSSLLAMYDYVIFDMGAGASEESINFILSVDEIVVVTTPEPTSITDAYAMIKHIHMHNNEIPFLILVNRVSGEKEGYDTFNRLQTVAKRFLDCEVKPFGIIPDDKAVQQAVTKQTPFILNESSAVSKAMFKITERFEDRSFTELHSQRKRPFVSKLKRFLFER
jgi:flagellar biosynthesis protein FlhG